MGRTRSAVLEGAARSIEKYGSRRTTMADIAALAGVAKATVYNHFRTKPEVYAALVVAEVETLAAACLPLAGSGRLAEALTAAAERIGSHPVVRRLAAEEPAVLARLVTPSGAAGWQVARRAVTAGLTAAGRAAEPSAVDAVLRWLSSQLPWMATPDELVLAAGLLADGLPAQPLPEPQPEPLPEPLAPPGA